MTCMAFPSVQVGVRHQREIARALDRRRELALVVGARSGDPCRDDLAVLADEVLQQIDVLVVDPLDLLGGEAAELAALEKLLRTLLFALAVSALAFSLAFSEAASTSGWGHAYSPSANSICVACSKSVRLERLLAARNPFTFTLLPSSAGLTASLRGASPRGASPGPRTDFAFSSFIIGEGVVQARSILIIRCRNTASLNLNECSSSPSVSASHSIFMST